MAADYAGAIAAIKQRFAANWTGTSLANVGYVNMSDPTTVDGSGNPTPWVLFETVNSGSKIEGFGAAGNNNVVYYGLIKVHVFVPVLTGVDGSQSDDGYVKAIAAGEIFRNKVLYDAVTPGCYVRTGYRLDEQPRVDEGDASSNDGQWFAVTATIPFEYWHRA